MASEGPNSFAAQSSDNAVGTEEWTNPTQAATQDDATAQAGVVGSPPTYETIKLVVAGSVVGDNFASGEAFTADNDTYTSFGGEASNGGQSLTGEDVKAEDFGIVIQCQGASHSQYLKLLNPQFSTIPDNAEVNGFTIEVDDGIGAVGAATIDHVRITVHYTEAAAPPTLTSIDPDSGTTEGGTTVTLTGTDFVDGATVTFDGDAATNVTFNSSTEIECDTPAHAAGAVDVVVTNPDDQTDTLAGAYTYVEPAAGGGGGASGMSGMSGLTTP